MNIAFFGGTFDPIHRGHLAIARAARERFALQRIYFVPADVPPHKLKQPITGFEHRYAMVALATAEEKDFVPSLLEAPPRYSNLLAFRGRDEREQPAPANYSIHTVRRLKRELPKNARLFFLIGIDAFRDIATWRQPELLLDEVEFIVASRPGFSLADVAQSLPASLRPLGASLNAFRRQPARGSLVVPGATIHFLSDVQENVSATGIRAAAADKKSLGRLVPAAVAEYIHKQGLYGPSASEQLQVATTRVVKTRAARSKKH